MKSWRLRMVIGFLLAGFWLLPLGAQADTDYTWKGVTGGAWGTNTNWDPTGIPSSSGDTATINNGSTVNLSGGYSVNQLTMADGNGVTLNNGGTLNLAGATPAVTGGTLTLHGVFGGDSILNANGAVATLNATVVGDHKDYSRLIGAGFTNQGLLHGSADIETHLTNTGTVTADPGKTMFFEYSNNIVNHNVIQGSSEGANKGTVRFSSSLISGTGSLNPNGGTIAFTGATVTDHNLGDGNFVVEGNSTLKGANTLTSGAVVTVNNGVSVYLGATGAPATVNGGTIVLHGVFGSDSILNANGAVATLNATVAGDHQDYSKLVGAGFINQGLLHGSADIETHLTNTGTVTADPGKTMFFEYSNNIVNHNVIQGSSEGANKGTVRFSSSLISGTGSLNPNGGTIAFTGATVTDHNLGDGNFVVEGNSTLRGANTLASGAVVTVNNGVSLYLGATGAPATVNGGAIVLNGVYGADSILNANGAVATLNGTVEGKGGTYSRFTGTGFVNNGTIEGAGHFEAPVTNNGEVIASGGTLLVATTLTGSGNVTVQDTGTLDMNHLDFTAGNFSMLGNGVLTNNSSQTVTLTKNFSFTQTAESKWNGGSGFGLQMSGGGGQQALEVGGLDSGAVAAGFTANFHLGTLSLTESATYAYLLDAYNNGNRGGSGGEAEALYVDTLSLADGTTLNLNGLHLYTYLGGYTEVVDGDTRFGGTIINSPVPLPGTLLLLGSGLLGLAGVRRRFMRD